MEVDILYDDRQNKMQISDENIEAIKKTVIACLETEEMDGNFEVSVSFVTNEEIRELNRQYRNVDSETDVLSFPLDDEDEDFSMDGDVVLLGDIVLSTEKIIEQAKDFGHSLEREMLYLVAHSTLHLLGYDHMDDEDKSEMRQREKEVMKKLSIFK